MKIKLDGGYECAVGSIECYVNINLLLLIFISLLISDTKI